MDEEKKREKKKFPAKILIWLPLIIGIIALVILVMKGGSDAPEEETVEILTETTLVNTVDIAELSTAEFTYNGIAEIPKEDDSGEIKCTVRYEAKVKASVDMEDIQFEIDDINKTIKPILPRITLTPVLDDQQGFSFIPEDSAVDLQEIIKACKEDITAEAEETEELRDSAKENLRDIIQALTYPIISSKGYVLVWE